MTSDSQDYPKNEISNTKFFPCSLGSVLVSYSSNKLVSTNVVLARVLMT